MYNITLLIGITCPVYVIMIGMSHATSKLTFCTHWIAAFRLFDNHRLISTRLPFLEILKQCH